MASAHEIAVDVCRRLWEDWGWEGALGERRPVQVYSVNIPLIEDALKVENRKVCWTKMWRNTYGQLFKVTNLYVLIILETSAPGIDLLDVKPFRPEPSTETGDVRNRPVKSDPPHIPTTTSSTAHAGPAALPPDDPTTSMDTDSSKPLKFHFAPNMGPLLFPASEDLPEGTDAWAFAKGFVSVTPMRAEYAGLGEGGCGFRSDEDEGYMDGRMWNITEGRI